MAEEFYGVAREAFRRTGAEMWLGLNLPALHIRAGLGPPDGIEAGVRLDRLPVLAPMFEAVYRSVLPTALSLGLTTPERSERWFEAFARESAASDGHAALWPLLIGTWKQKTMEAAT